MRGRSVTGMAPRNSASRTALPATWCASMTEATVMAIRARERVCTAGRQRTSTGDGCNWASGSRAGVRCEEDGGRCVRHHASASSLHHCLASTQASSNRIRARALAGRSAAFLARHCSTTLLEVRRNRQLRPLGRWRRCLLHVGHGHRRGARFGEDQRPGEEVVGDAAERVDVGPPVDALLAHGDLRRDVAGRARRDPLDREMGEFLGLRRLHQAEIEHLHEVVLQRHLARHDVGRLQVAVHEAAGVGFLQRQTHLPQQVDHA